ncbi:hypothetical protein QKW52_12645 [Bacillus sonorensis]|nr:hypothetical protein [Bacillus sonorensis]
MLGLCGQAFPEKASAAEVVHQTIVVEKGRLMMEKDSVLRLVRSLATAVRKKAKNRFSRWRMGRR